MKIRQKINNLTFLYEVEPHIGKNNYKSRKAKYKCYCGKKFDSYITHINSGNTRSCGCLLSSNMTTHGLRASKQYVVWAGMKQRCYDKNIKQYKDWGGRGITVCEEWVNNFETFYDWCNKNGYKKGLQIDRINNDGNYEPSNCRFVTRTTNNQNRRFNKGYHKYGNKFKAQIMIDYTTFNLGIFDTKEEAICAYIKAKNKTKEKSW
jgi:hypothetical protein